MAPAEDEKRDPEKRDSSSSQNGTSGESHALESSVDAKPEYPTGWKLACIILALMMGIFLASLDMVNSVFPYSLFLHSVLSSLNHSFSSA